MKMPQPGFMTTATIRRFGRRETDSRGRGGRVWPRDHDDHPVARQAQPCSWPKTPTGRRLRGLSNGRSRGFDGSPVCIHAAGHSMTTPAKPSSAAYVLQRLRFSACLLAAGLALAVPLVGCDLFHSDFDIAVGNRTASTVSIFANGGKIGDVGSNLTATFTVEETPIGRHDRFRGEPNLSETGRSSDLLRSRHDDGRFCLLEWPPHWSKTSQPMLMSRRVS